MKILNWIKNKMWSEMTPSFRIIFYTIVVFILVMLFFGKKIYG